MLATKAASAAFVRCISENGRKWVLRIAGVGVASRLHVIHMGVRVPADEVIGVGERPDLVLAMPANLLPVKGHCHLIDAVAQLMKLDLPRFKVLLFGDGPLRAELAAAIRGHQLEGVVELAGHIDHRELIGLYEGGHIDIVVLPSITTTDGEHEGIPVALMEAMAHGIPVVSTRSGSIAELVDENSGVLIPEKNVAELRDALASLLLDRQRRHALGRGGRLRIEREFNVQKVASAFVGLANNAT
jgi:glycosyltransferase involved in cell wall biosynthesis